MGLFDSLKNVFTDKPPKEALPPTESLSPTLAVDSQLLSPYFLRVNNINNLEEEIEALSDTEIQEQFAQFKADVRNGVSLDQIADRTFALVREATFRVLSLRHYDVQLVGGFVLHEACIAEMATGEGKTIVAALPAVLNALSAKSVFIVTVNDYLARRDAELVGQVFKFCGFSVGLIQASMSSAQRREAYSCDIVYVTNSELGFDYLRDNLAMTPDDIVLSRPLSYCIIDEADSILIDEARTPLIISSKVAADTSKYSFAKKAADALTKDVHYTVDEKEQSVQLTERGFSDLETALRVQDLYDPLNPWAAFITNALKAKELFQKDVNYILGEDDSGNPQVQIVDEFTGRVMKGRRWSDGLHQAVEAKEDLTIENETTVAAKISYQSFFGLFEKLAGMTGTASTEAEELGDVYKISVISIPTALPLGRKDYPDVVFKNASGKYRAVMREIARVAPTGRPILIGTTSVEASETLSSLLTEVEVDHDVLNAKPESALRESEIVAQAGRKYSITIATNMAGRGTDILLGGNADYFSRSLARRALAAQDEALYATLSDPSKPILINDEELPADIPDDLMAELNVAASEVWNDTQTKSFDSVKDIDEIVSVAAEFGPIPNNNEAIAKLRDVMGEIKAELEETVEEEREEVLDLGGLLVIGTERAESRRVDNQLRGRAGRQGDPGGSRFFLALDDRLFRVFGGDKVQGILESFRVDEDTPIENTLVIQTLDTSQETVEAYFRDIRRSVFEYDNVLSTQRAAFYSDRRKIVLATSEDLRAKFSANCIETANEIVAGNIGKSDGSADDLVKLSAKMGEFFNGIVGVSADELGSATSVTEIVASQVEAVISKKRVQLESMSGEFDSDVLKFLWLTQMDNVWKEHMKRMEYLKEFSSLRVYGNEDPLQVFQEEGYTLFKNMLTEIRRNNVYSYFQYEPKTAQVGSREA